MPRIRTVKPEFWDSPSTAKASPWARLAFIAMWNWADDYGRGTANLKELEGFIFPNDSFPMKWSGNTVRCSGNTVHFRDVVAEVSECYDVVFYEVDGRPYFAIPTWDKHQRNERRATASKYPPPPDLTCIDATSSGNTVHFRDSGAEAPNISGPGTGEQGNRGTGEQGRLRAATLRQRRDRFDEFYSLYPKKTARGKAKERWDSVVTDVDPDVIIAGLRRLLPWFATQVRDGKDYRPAAGPWLNQERWLDEPDEGRQLAVASGAEWFERGH